MSLNITYRKVGFLPPFHYKGVCFFGGATFSTKLTYTKQEEALDAARIMYEFVETLGKFDPSDEGKMSALADHRYVRE